MIAEFTPTHHRSISMGMVSAAWYLGATAAAFVGYALYTHTTMVGVGCWVVPLFPA